MKVSIITPTYNSSSYIESAVTSIINQTYTNWELLIVDDCSSDKTLTIASEFAKLDSRITIFRNNKNMGAAAARNLAMSHAKGDFLAFLDSDDIWHPMKLSKQLDFMRKNNIAFSFTSYEVIDRHGVPSGKLIDCASKRVFNYKDMLAKKATLGCSTVMLNRLMVGNISMPSIRTGQDYALWLSILKKGLSAHLLPETLTFYRITPGSISSNKLKKAMRQWFIYREIEKISFTMTCFYFLSYAFRATFR